MTKPSEPRRNACLSRVPSRTKPTAVSNVQALKGQYIEPGQLNQHIVLMLTSSHTLQLATFVMAATQKVFKRNLVNEGELKWGISLWRKKNYLSYELMASFVAHRSPRQKKLKMLSEHTHTHTPYLQWPISRMILPFLHHGICALAILRRNIMGITSIQLSFSVQHF